MTTPTNPTHPAAGEELKPKVDLEALAAEDFASHGAGRACGMSFIGGWKLGYLRAESAERQKREAVEKERDEALATIRHFADTWKRVEPKVLERECCCHPTETGTCCNRCYVIQEMRSALVCAPPNRDTLKARVAELERELARINVSWTETVKTGQQINEENKRLSGELATLRQELEAANGQKEEIRKQAVAFVQDGKILSEANDRLERQLADSTARVEAKDAALRKACQRLMELCRRPGGKTWRAAIDLVDAELSFIWRGLDDALTASAPTDAGQAEMRRCQACNRTWSLEDIANPGYCPHCSNKALAPYTQPADAGAESAKAATGWLPIEMAPKDALLVIWRKSWNSPLIAELTVRGWRPLGGATLVYPPTHWMPLPATPPETTEVRAVEPQCLKHLDDEHYCALPPGHSGPCGIIKGLYRNTPQAEQAEGEHKISACAQHGDHHDPSCARCAYLANHYRTGLVNLRSEKPQPQAEQAESAPTIEEHFGQPAGSFAKFVDGQQIAPGHNPDKLTNEQVETDKGWRLLNVGDVLSRWDDYWEATDKCWRPTVWAGKPIAPGDNTYRRRVTTSEGKGAK